MRNSAVLYTLLAAALTKEAGSGLRSRFRLVEQPHPLPGFTNYDAFVGARRVGAMNLRHNELGHGPASQVRSSWIDPQFQGMGLGKKMYGEVMRRQPGGALQSDSAVSRDAQRVWRGMGTRRGYDLQVNPDAQTIKGETRIPSEVKELELGKRMAGEPYREIPTQLFRAALTPEAVIGPPERVPVAWPEAPKKIDPYYQQQRWTEGANRMTGAVPATTRPVTDIFGKVVRWERVPPLE